MFQVKVVAIDKLMRELKVDEIPGPWLVHVDTQGSEYFLVHQGKEFFANEKIKALAISLSTHRTTEPWQSFKEVIGWFIDQGYRATVWGVDYTKETADKIPTDQLVFLRD